MMRKWMLATTFAGAFALAGPALAQSCDQNADSQVDADEAVACAKMDWDEISGGAEELSAGEYGMAKENLPAPEEVDANGDMIITEAEWSDYSKASFDAATSDTGGAMEASAHQTWREEGMRP